MFYLLGKIRLGKEVGKGESFLDVCIMRSKIINWNLMGLDPRYKRVVVKSLLRDSRSHIVCLQETKNEDMSNEMVGSVWGGWFVEWRHLQVKGIERM